MAIAQEITVVTAESCTGGRVALALTEAPNASSAVEGGFVTYTEGAKEYLGVPADILARSGAVSAEVARLMADAALARSNATVSVSITGVAGPTTDDDNNPVGLIYLASARKGAATRIIKKNFGPMNRDAMMFSIVHAALELLAEAVNARSNSVGQARDERSTQTAK